MSQAYSVIIITVPVGDEILGRIKSQFKTVHYHPDGQVPRDHAREADIWYSGWMGLPKGIDSLDQVPRTKVVQLSSAGANDFLKTPLMSSQEARKQIKVCSASGIHTLSIPQYVVCNVVNLYMKLQVQFHLARSEAEWPSRDRVVAVAGYSAKTHPGNRTLYGKTVGLLGYGHIARETARLFKAFNCNIIAANSKGDRRSEEGYRIPGTGDIDGSLPEALYSTNDPDSLATFLSKSDILVASLPSTPQTRYMLTQKHLKLLPEGAVFVNVGRGDLLRSEDILAALDTPSGLWGAVLDVTDPEPLPSGHPLFTHPNVIVTPHTSGSFENYYDAGAEVLLVQEQRLEEGKDPINVVDPAKGY
ncbi:oxidoreductase [Kwoniella heveanensis BCC8398]|uniref:Oxidoreductase n=1 Tax=Kwoniella heveanensis BCC8398 TaxID=1296120 RepID=A0A1B9GM94_9TREE|nr:oxidoreductase [Kwoniella heveanensis BCC8398]